MRILLIEDDAMIGNAVRHGLSQAGFAVDWVTDGRAAELSLANGVYDLAILDLGLPKKDGMTILSTLRGLGNSIPVLIASARDTVRDRIAGLEAGADDYVLKPFDLDELVARVRALLRRHAGSGSPLLRFGALVLDPVCKSVTKDGEPVELSAREFAVLGACRAFPATASMRQLGQSRRIATRGAESLLFKARIHQLDVRPATHAGQVVGARPSLPLAEVNVARPGTPASASAAFGLLFWGLPPPAPRRADVGCP